MDERASATDATEIENAAAVVLAGGQSTRFDGGEKAAATVGGQSLLARAVGAARRAVGAPPLVAVASPAQREAFESLLAEPVQFVFDAPDRQGPLAGLASAADAATAEWLLVVGCDMPLVDSRAVAWLASRRRPDLDAVVPADGGGIHPLHAWYRRRAVTAALPALPADASLRALLDELSVETLPADRAPAGADLARSVRNVNTVADLEAARRAWQDP